MNVTMNTNEVIVECRYKQDVYISGYLGDVCCAETLRNCCVNLCIDPDMVDGQLNNVKVYRRATSDIDTEYTFWEYSPYQKLSACSILESDGLLHLRILLST